MAPWSGAMMPCNPASSVSIASAPAFMRHTAIASFNLRLCDMPSITNPLALI